MFLGIYRFQVKRVWIGKERIGSGSFDSRGLGRVGSLCSFFLADEGGCSWCHLCRCRAAAACGRGR